MKKIQMVDLQGQYEPLKAQIQQSFDEVLSSAAFVNGPQVQALQKELEQYLQVKHVIPCANGTDALQIAMMGLGLKPGDEVITADFTFAATVEVIALLGLTPVTLMLCFNVLCLIISFTLLLHNKITSTLISHHDQMMQD